MTHHSPPQTKSASSKLSKTLASSFISLLSISSFVLLASAQHDMTSNVTDLSGTWSSGWGSVRTGAGFANPVNFSFNYPPTSGISMSFTSDGFWEEAQYRFVSNGTRPNCVKAIVLWQHGRYTLEANGSLTTQPIEADGRIQIQDPCAAQTSIITYYYQPGLYQTWQIFNDAHHNTYNLQLQAFDNALFPRLYLVTRPPDMLPTNQLTTKSKKSKRSLPEEHSGSAQSSPGLWKRWYDAWAS
ncbi:Reversal of tor2 lethality [Puccinia graminis f. sp. tritici]|uniref:Reversal of tor2 lethality n=1 Tax=Puccinia graminis f. sp. tritici TaxID=56615 RepID=A0A5B0NHT5_PUCGR|nr:Reversal of tor2 lethality [Puccinia graminis f. sp. tritici]